MDDIRVCLVFRAVRRSKRLRQVDVGAAAGLSQQFVSDLERGKLKRMKVARIRTLAAVLEIEMPFGPRWHGPELHRLLDADHAGIVGVAVGHLQSLGWSVLVEWSFNHYGERGSVDIVGWHPVSRALAVIEVKTRIVDLQDLLGALDRKVRVARLLLPKERRWEPRSVGRILVLPDHSTARLAVSRHRAVVDAVVPAQTVEVKRWLRRADTNVSGVWFLRNTVGTGTARASRGR